MMRVTSRVLSAACRTAAFCNSAAARSTTSPSGWACLRPTLRSSTPPNSLQRFDGSPPGTPAPPAEGRSRTALGRFSRWGVHPDDLAVPGELDGIDDDRDADGPLSFSEVKALAAGSSLLTDKAEAGGDPGPAAARRTHSPPQPGRAAPRRHPAPAGHHPPDHARADIGPPSASAAIPPARNSPSPLTGGARQARRSRTALERPSAKRGRHGRCSPPQRHAARAAGRLPVTAEIAAPLGQPTATLAIEGAPGTDVRIALRDFPEPTKAA